MIIEISALKFQAILGILDVERITPQNIVVDVRIEYTYEKDTFINYAHVATRIETIMKTEKFELIETAILFLQNTLHLNFPTIKTLYLRIAKPDILDSCTVSVSDSISFL